MLHPLPYLLSRLKLVASQAYVTSGKGFSPYGENKVYPEIQFQPQTQKNQFLTYSTLAGGSVIAADLFSKKGFAQSAPGIITSDSLRPTIPYGVASGDVTRGQAVIWSRCDRPARMIVEYSLDESFRSTRYIRRIMGPAATETTDYTARINLTGLPDGRQVFYRVSFQDLNNINVFSEPVTGSFQAVPKARTDVKFIWSGDSAGQGWGINPDFGGMRIFETMRQLQPDFFIHSGDIIYADNPIQAEVRLADGSVWRNVTTEAKAKVAETLDEFRGNYIYNLMDDNLRRFNAEVPTMAQWDDHETTNNWFPTEVLTNVGGDARYTVKSVALLSARARQALLEYMPVRINSRDPERIYRSFNYGSALEVFMIDMRSYRGPNTANLQTEGSEETEFLGRRQIQWLKRSLLSSKATWKVIASDMPIGLVVPDGPNAFEAVANAENGLPLGRELEIADLLRFIKRHNIRNVVWVTADVHYCASHYYDPNLAQFQDFLPFWEFVSGPLHAGTFGPNRLDNTFGPQVKFQKAPEPGLVNLPPSAGLQFFGMVKIDGDTQVMTVSHYTIDGEILDSIDLTPER
jgi:alkaline phosphatase D